MDWPDSPDAAPLGDGLRALDVDRPTTLDALREAVACRAAEGLALYPQGGRVALDYGGVPGRPGVALDTTGLDRVVDYPAADMTITVGAGITLARLQELLAAEGQFLPLDAPHPDRATIGGIYATNTSGPRRFGWGRPRDMIIGVSFVTADGKEIKGGGRVVKNVAGYDLPKLLTGSMGTLGVISQVTLKVRPRPEASALVVVPFDDEDTLGTVLEALNTSATRPVAIELVNRRGRGHLALDLGSSAASDWTLIVGLEDNAASVQWQIERLLGEVGVDRGRCSVLRDEEARSGWNALVAFASIEADHRLTAVASLPRSAAFAFARRLDPASWTVGVRAGSGIVTAHAAIDVPDEGLVAAVARLRAEATRLGGSVILSRCPTPWKARLQVWGDRRGDWAIMEKIRAALDPRGMMNPGRFVGTI